jgi:hypothetical protein
MTGGLSWHEYPVSVRLRIIHYTVNHILSGFRETDSLRWVLKGLPTKCLYRELLCEMNFNRMIFELDAGSPPSVEQLSQPDVADIPKLYRNIRLVITRCDELRLHFLARLVGLLYDNGDLLVLFRGCELELCPSRYNLTTSKVNCT